MLFDLLLLLSMLDMPTFNISCRAIWFTGRRGLSDYTVTTNSDIDCHHTSLSHIKPSTTPSE